MGKAGKKTFGRHVYESFGVEANCSFAKSFESAITLPLERPFLLPRAPPMCHRNPLF